MSILVMRSKKVSFNYKLPTWLYDNLVREAKGENINNYITSALLEARPQLNREENAGFKQLMKTVLKK